MPRHPLKKEKWTITFDQDLKQRVQTAARRLRIYPVQLLETLVREKLDPYGFAAVRDSVAYVTTVRKESQRLTDKRFLTEMKAWEKK